MAPRSEGEKLYLSSTAIFMSELLKLLISIVVCCMTECGGRWSTFLNLMYREMIEGRREFAKLLIPSGLYVVQNNLNFIAASNLPAAICQVLYQLKILTTAFFAEVMLGKSHSLAQRISVLSLAVGVAFVQLSQQQDARIAVSAKADNSSQSGINDKHTDVSRGSTAVLGGHPQNYALGVTCVVLSCITSGFAGVYFEKVLKSSNSTSLWVRNIQMALIGVALAMAVCVYNDYDAIIADGFFQGYNAVVYLVIFLSAAGGLIVALVVKYADNVLKGFATSASIVISCLVSALYFQETQLTLLFAIGAAVVCVSAVVYGAMPLQAKAVSADNKLANGNGSASNLNGGAYALTSSRSLSSFQV